MSAAEQQDEQPEKTPADWAKHWQREMDAANTDVQKWHIQGEKIVKRFKDERDGDSTETRLNLFTANVQTLRALLYGKTPQVSVDRRFSDAGDAKARVAAEMLERLLNTDIERDSDGYATAMQYALDDRLLAGLGNVRLRYVADWAKHPDKPAIPAKAANTNVEMPANDNAELPPLAPAVPGEEYKTREDVEVDYVYWRDQRWSPSRVFHEVRWWAFKALMTRKEVAARFGEVHAMRCPLKVGGGERVNGEDAGQKAHPKARAEVWEIWDKETKQVFWWVEGAPEVLDMKPDTLELEGFWPFPRPMFANLTTSGLMPRPDYTLAQDLYLEIDMISTRIQLLERAVRVVGLYNGQDTGLRSMLDDASANQMLPVDKWAGFAERGGIKGSVEFMPLDMIVGALDKLREYRTELLNLLYQVTGMSDIMRGQASTQTTATEQAIKARFASVRVQALQDEFARFASDVQRIKAEIICKLFDDSTILQRSNIQFTPDAQLGQAAVALLKSQFSCYRVQVKPEAVSLTDFAALKQEKTEVVTALAQYFQAMLPAVEMLPGSMPFVLQLAQWMVSGLKGASTMEGIFDRAVQQAQQAAMAPPAPPPPDPKMQTEQFKAQAQSAHTAQELQADMTRVHAEAQTQAALAQHQAGLNVREAEAIERVRALHAVNEVTSGGKE